MPKRILIGTVTSNKTDKTVTVLVERKVKHPLYGKIIRRSKKYHAHDEANEYELGDIVRIEETKPISKTKTWAVKDRVVSGGVQAVGAAGILGTWVAIAASAVPSKQRGRALGTAVTIMSAGGIAGPALSGILVDGFGWRSVFLVDAAFGLLAFSVAYIVLPPRRPGAEVVRRGLGDWQGLSRSSL